MNPTDRASIVIVFLFYIIALSCGYFIYSEFKTQNKKVERLILTINSDEIDWKNQTAVAYEEVTGESPIKKTFLTNSIVDISAAYEQKGFKLDYITEFIKKSMDQEILVTRIWFSKTK